MIVFVPKREILQNDFLDFGSITVIVKHNTHIKTINTGFRNVQNVIKKYFNYDKIILDGNSHYILSKNKVIVKETRFVDKVEMKKFLKLMNDEYIKHVDFFLFSYVYMSLNYTKLFNMCSFGNVYCSEDEDYLQYTLFNFNEDTIESLTSYHYG